MRRRQPKQVLQDAMAHFEAVADHGSGDLSDHKTIDAICMRLSAGIKGLSGLSDADRVGLFGDVWTQMWGMRNRITHGYLLSSRRSCAALSSETCR